MKILLIVVFSVLIFFVVRKIIFWYIKKYIGNFMFNSKYMYDIFLGFHEFSLYDLDIRIWLYSNIIFLYYLDKIFFFKIKKVNSIIKLAVSLNTGYITLPDKNLIKFFKHKIKCLKTEYKLTYK